MIIDNNKNKTQLQSQLLGMLYFSIISCFTANDNVSQKIKSVQKNVLISSHHLNRTSSGYLPRYYIVGI